MGLGTLKPAAISKNIMVIGGGVSGMKFAEIATIRGHKVSLYEKTDLLGGQVNIAEKIPFRVEIAEVPRYLRIQLEKHGVPIYYNTKIDPDKVAEENPDIIVVATGSYPFVKNIPGSDTSSIKIIDVNTALLKPELIGNSVLVYDNNGHIKGAGILEYVLALGSNTYYVTPWEQIGIELDGLTLVHIKRRIYRYKNLKDFICEYGIKKIKNNTVILSQIINTVWEKKLEDIDTIILADRGISDNTLYKELKKTRKGLYAIGDCVAPRRIEQGILEAEILARNL
jgi:heterodisulfide reductase subunit A-like polyferredoxin